MVCYFFIIYLVTEITIQPVSHTTVIALEDVTLNCSASVDDDVTYSWHRVGGSVPLRSIVQSNSTFTIPRATPYDVGAYYCMAKKKEISVESNRAVVMVNGEKLYWCQLLLTYNKLLQIN